MSSQWLCEVFEGRLLSEKKQPWLDSPGYHPRQVVYEGQEDIDEIR